MNMNNINRNDLLRLLQINQNYGNTYGQDLVDGSPYLQNPAGIQQLAKNIMQQRMMGNIPVYERGLSPDIYPNRFRYPQLYYGSAGNPFGHLVYPRR